MSVLLLHSLQRVRTLVMVIGALLALLQVILILVARSLENAGQFAQLATLFPPFVRALMGPAMTAFLSFGGIVSLGYFEPAVIFAFVGLAIAVGTRIALEIETGFIDLILARPVARHKMVTRSIAVVILSLCFVVALMLAGTWIGLRTLAPANAERPSLRLILSLAGNLGVLGLCWSGISLALASASRRRGVAGGIAGVLALFTFLLDYIARIWEPAKTIAWLSPFTYFSPLDLVTGSELPIKNLIVLGGIAMAGFATAYVLFLRRDISR
jgi:ABC-2 type transport system permease protein